MLLPHYFYQPLNGNDSLYFSQLSLYAMVFQFSSQPPSKEN